jgi:hypothetical protein
MYVAKFSSEGIFYRATLFKKDWSDEILSNKIIELDSKRFIFYFWAKYWINKKISNILIDQKMLEIINK